MAQARGRGGGHLETRLALAICVALCSTLCGKAAADAVRRRYRVLDLLAEGIQTLRIHMTGMLQPVPCALENAGCEIMTRVAEGMGEGCSAGDAWRAVRDVVARRGGAADALTEDDLDVLDALFSGLGQSGREEQEALLDAAWRRICRLRDEALKKAGEADRLYVSLGLLIGLMLALIVI